MGIHEIILEEAKKEAMDLGMKKGIKKGIREGIKEGIDLGIDLGIEKGKIEVVISAHKKGITKELIAEIVQLPLAKVEEIIAANQAP